MEKKSYYFKVTLKVPLFKALTYQFSEPLRPGQRVLVPLGKRRVIGLVLEEDLEASKQKYIKNILEVYDYPTLSLERIRWLQWMSRYYHYPLGLIAGLKFSSRKTF